MAPLGGLSQAWISAEAAMPRGQGWEIVGLIRFGDEWVAWADGPGQDQPISGAGPSESHALSRLADRLRERRGPMTG
jgi:hypothetical protein